MSKFFQRLTKLHEPVLASAIFVVKKKTQRVLIYSKITLET